MLLALFATALIVIVGGGSIAATVRAQRSDASQATSTLDAAEVEAPPVRREPENALEHVIVFLRDRKWARWGLTALSVALLAGAGWTVGYPFYTNLYQDRYQDRLARDLDSDEIRDAYLRRSVAVGDSLTRIRIPAIGVDVVVVEGTTASALRAGAGHYPTTPLPCEIGNVAIAGHRTTYGRPFHDLDKLKPGDQIILETPIGTCTYAYQDSKVVLPTEVGVVMNTPSEARLTLTTCHPKGSARQRLVARATMVSSAVAHG